MSTKRWCLTGMLVLALTSFLGAQNLPITIDAEKDAWYEELTGPGDGYIFIPSRAFVTDGGGVLPDGDEDISAFVWVGWDESYFYAYGEVTDDILIVNAAIWANDALEFKFDPDPTTRDTSPGQAGSVAAVRMSAFGQDNSDCPDGTECWDDLVSAGELDSVTVDSSDWARRETNEGYAVEFRLPWSNVTIEGRNVNVGVRNTFGMAVGVNDNDSNTRDHQLQWSAGMTDFVWNDVREHGTVEFLDDNKLNLVATNTSITSIPGGECEFAENDSADAWYAPPTPGSGTTGNFEIEIDGERDAWYDGLTGPDEGYIYIPSRASNAGFTLPNDDNDCSALVWLGWDETHFYVYGEVADDSLFVSSTVGSWENDGVEVRMDGNPNIADESPGTAGSVAGAGLTALAENDPRATGSTNSLGGWTSVDSTDYARTDFAGGYSVEFRVPWAEVASLSEGRAVNVGVDSIFGLAIAFNDNDGVGRVHQIQWAAVMDDATWRDTKMLGTAQFLSDNKIMLSAVNSAQCATPGFATNDSAEVWYDPSQVTSIALFDEGIPTTFSLEQNYPNPFNPETTIRYSLPKSDEVTVAIYNMMGQLVRTLVQGERQEAGTYEITWNGKNDHGLQAASGVYLYRLTSKSTVVTRKMILIK